MSHTIFWGAVVRWMASHSCHVCTLQLSCWHFTHCIMLLTTTATFCCPWVLLFGCVQAVVFCNRKPAAEWLSRRLTAAGCPAAYLSAELPQEARMAAMEAVRGFRVRIIVSTDVMARGVDFDR
jgi:superfamily II DNA/RNA helicase